MTFTQNMSLLAKCLDKQTPEQNLLMARRYTRNFVRSKLPQSSQPIGFMQDTVDEKKKQEDYVRKTLGWNSCSNAKKEVRRKRYDERRVTTATVRVNNNVLQRLLFSDSKEIRIT